MHGLRLTEGTTVRSALEETGFDKKFLFLRFARNGQPDHDVLFAEDVDLAALPFRTVSIRAMADAVKNPMQGFNLQNVGALVFGTLIDRYAKVGIVRGIDVTTRKEVVRLSIKIRNFSTTAVCELDKLKGFVEKRDDRDQERDNEEE